MARVRLARSEGVTRVNQRVKPRNGASGSNLADTGRDAVRDLILGSGSTPEPVLADGEEAALKACGVGAVMLPGGAGGDCAAVAARAARGPDRGAAGVPPCHGAPLDRPVQRRGAGRAGRPAPVRAAPAGRAPADQADHRAAGPPRPVDAAADPAVPVLA